MATIPARDLHVRIREKDGKTYDQCVRVWDAQRFLAARTEDLAKEGGTITMISKGDYDAARTQR